MADEEDQTKQEFPLFPSEEFEMRAADERARCKNEKRKRSKSKENHSHTRRQRRRRSSPRGSQRSGADESSATYSASSSKSKRRRISSSLFSDSSTAGSLSTTALSSTGTTATTATTSSSTDAATSLGIGLLQKQAEKLQKRVEEQQGSQRQTTAYEADETDSVSVASARRSADEKKKASGAASATDRRRQQRRQSRHRHELSCDNLFREDLAKRNPSKGLAENETQSANRQINTCNKINEGIMELRAMIRASTRYVHDLESLIRREVTDQPPASRDCRCLVWSSSSSNSSIPSANDAEANDFLAPPGVHAEDIQSANDALRPRGAFPSNDHRGAFMPPTTSTPIVKDAGCNYCQMGEGCNKPQHAVRAKMASESAPHFPASSSAAGIQPDKFWASPMMRGPCRKPRAKSPTKNKHHRLVEQTRDEEIDPASSVRRLDEGYESNTGLLHALQPDISTLTSDTEDIVNEMKTVVMENIVSKFGNPERKSDPTTTAEERRSAGRTSTRNEFLHDAPAPSARSASPFSSDEEVTYLAKDWRNQEHDELDSGTGRSSENFGNLTTGMSRANFDTLVFPTKSAFSNIDSDVAGRTDSEPKGAMPMPSAWPSNVIPFVIDPTFSEKQRRNIAHAFSQYHDNTCVRFKPRVNEPDYVFIRRAPNEDEPCTSNLGFQGGEQVITLNDKCVELKGTIMHELMHVLGFDHEQSRRDRDKFVTVNWENILPGYERNFYQRQHLTDLNYDYGSIMHYPPYAFAERPSVPTLVPKVDFPLQLIGQRFRLSKMDRSKINQIYRCDKYPMEASALFPTMELDSESYMPEAERLYAISSLARQYAADPYGFAARNRSSVGSNTDLFLDDDVVGGRDGDDDGARARGMSGLRLADADFPGPVRRRGDRPAVELTRKRARRNLTTRRKKRRDCTCGVSAGNQSCFCPGQS